MFFLTVTSGALALVSKEKRRTSPQLVKFPCENTHTLGPLDDLPHQLSKRENSAMGPGQEKMCMEALKRSWPSERWASNVLERLQGTFTLLFQQSSVFLYRRLLLSFLAVTIPPFRYPTHCHSLLHSLTYTHTYTRLFDKPFVPRVICPACLDASIHLFYAVPRKSTYTNPFANILRRNSSFNKLVLFIITQIITDDIYSSTKYFYIITDYIIL